MDSCFLDERKGESSLGEEIESDGSRHRETCWLDKQLAIKQSTGTSKERIICGKLFYETSSDLFGRSMS